MLLVGGWSVMGKNLCPSYVEEQKAILGVVDLQNASNSILLGKKKFTYTRLRSWFFAHKRRMVQILLNPDLKSQICLSAGNGMKIQKQNYLKGGLKWDQCY